VGIVLDDSDDEADTHSHDGEQLQAEGGGTAFVGIVLDDSDNEADTHSDGGEQLQAQITLVIEEETTAEEPDATVLQESIEIDSDSDGQRPAEPQIVRPEILEDVGVPEAEQDPDASEDVAVLADSPQSVEADGGPTD
jgi:hypothetical protein